MVLVERQSRNGFQRVGGVRDQGAKGRPIKGCNPLTPEEEGVLTSCSTAEGLSGTGDEARANGWVPQWSACEE